MIHRMKNPFDDTTLSKIHRMKNCSRTQVRIPFDDKSKRPEVITEAGGYSRVQSLMDPLFESLPIMFKLKLETRTRQNKEMEKNLIQCVRYISKHLKFSSAAAFNAVSDQRKRGTVATAHQTRGPPDHVAGLRSCLFQRK